MAGSRCFLPSTGVRLDVCDVFDRCCRPYRARVLTAAVSMILHVGGWIFCDRVAAAPLVSVDLQLDATDLWTP